MNLSLWSLQTLALWPHKFKLVLTVVLKVNSLSQQLVIHNTGDDAFEFTTLLHTYFRIDNLSTTEVYATTRHTPPHNPFLTATFHPLTPSPLPPLPLSAEVCRV